MKYLISIPVLFVFLLPYNVFAACNVDGLTVVYVNGIFTSNRGDAENDTKNLKDNFERILGIKDINFLPGYNPSHLTGLGDVAETVSQILNNSISNYDLSNILFQIHPEVTTQKIFLVGHSQGTFYTNEIYDYLINHGVPKEAVGVYNIATPDSSVAGYESVSEQGAYLTSSNDKVINLVRNLASKVNAKQPLSANIAIPLTPQEATNSFGGHSFSGVYLANDSVRIVSDIESALKKLSATEISNTAGDSCFIPPAKGISYYAQKSILSVADIVVTGVIAANNGIAAVGDIAYNGIFKAIAAVTGATKNIFAAIINDNIQSQNLNLLAEVSLNSNLANQPDQNNLSSVDKKNPDNNFETVASAEKPLAKEVDANLKQDSAQEIVLSDLSESLLNEIVSSSTQNQSLNTSVETNNVQKQNIQICSFQTAKIPSRQKLIINEVAWMGGHASANDEWIELKNISGSELDISGWQLLDKDEQINITLTNTDLTRTNAENKWLLKPGEFVLLERTDDNSVPGITADLIYAGALSNTSEGLRLFDNKCNLADEVLADSDWPAGDPGARRTMERSGDLTWHTYSGNGESWGGVMIMGTPKHDNSSIVIFSSGGVSATASGSGASTNTQQQTNSNQQSTAKILISEVQAYPVEDRFIELYNPNDSVIDLTNWYIQRKTQSGDSFGSLISKTYFDGKTIGAHGYFLISRESLAGADVILDSLTLTESNAIRLKNSNGDVIDKTGWGQVGDCEGVCAPAMATGQSIQRKYQNNSFIDTDNNAGDFEIQNCPSPKAQSKTCQSAQANQAPSAFFVYTPQNPQVGEEIIFNAASSTDSDGQIVSYQWDFGDGATSTVSIATTTHTYSQVGDYQVGLVVFDNQNVSSTASSTISVEPLSGTNNIVISEIQAGTADNADNEFIELYNPTDQAISLANWSLERKTSQIATSTKNLVLNFSATSTIPSKGFFLIAHNDYNGLMSPDLRYSNNSNPLAYDDDVIILQDSSDSIIDEVLYDEVSAGKSLERKANATSTADSMINSDDRFLGNSYDTDNLEDFILRDISNPQNSLSLPEPRNAPTAPQNFNIQYSSSAMKLIFGWQPSQDYSGATSTLIYKIIDIGNASSTLAAINTASTTAEIFISEIGRDYKFSIQAFDKEGLSSDSASTQIEAPAAQINNSPQVLISQLDKSTGLDCSINSYGHTCLSPISNYQDLGTGLSGIVRKITINMAINTDRISSFIPYLYDVDVDIPYYGESLQFSKETMAYIQRDYTFDFGRPISLDPTHRYQIQFSYGSYSGDGFQIFGSANSNSYPDGEWQTDSAVKDAYFILESAQSRVLLEAPREQTFVDNPVNFIGAYDNLNNSDKIRFVVTELNSYDTVIKDFDIPQSSNSVAVPYSFNISLTNGDYQYHVFLYKSSTEEVSNHSDVFNFQVTDRPQNASIFQLYKGTAVNCPLNSYSGFCSYSIPHFQDLGKNLSGQVDSIIINARVDVEAPGVSNFSASLYDLTADINYVTNNIIPESFAQKDYDFKLNTPVILDVNHQYKIQINFGSWYGGGLVIFGSNNSNSYSAGSWGDNQSSDEKLKDIYFILTMQ